MQPPARSGEIYDLGYRNYDGPRLGRRYAIRSLTTLSLRNTFGLGRGAWPKVIAFTLVGFAMVPALVQLVIGALQAFVFDAGQGDGYQFVRPEEYYGFVQVILVLFVAAMASELVGNDRKNNTLPLYFSRPIHRSDYVLAKVGALTLGLQMLTLVPQLLMFLGSWFGASDQSAWFADNIGDLPAIVVSSVLFSAEFAAIAILIATFANRRAFALVSILGAFLLTLMTTAIVADLLPRSAARVVMLLSPIYVARAVTFVLFDAMPRVRPIEFAEGPGEQIAAVELPGLVWVAALLAHVAIAVAFAIRRYRDTI
ncbi:MAG TPA: ABC transporter permease subunit [Ilumatobacter sp.]|nr:ABC transporter permease subunit [Ilumatobacter sp.]